MAETYKKLEDGTLEIRKTADAVTSTMSEKEIIGKIAEVQTEIDHLNNDISDKNIDKAAKELEKAEWQSKLEMIKVIAIPK